MKKLFQYNLDIPLHLGTLSRKNALLCLRMKSQLDALLTTQQVQQVQQVQEECHGKQKKQAHLEHIEQAHKKPTDKPTQNSIATLALQDIEEQNNIQTSQPCNTLCLVLAVSGGIDSISMLAMFVALQTKYPISLHVAHINHAIRSESDEEAILVENICKKFNIIFHYEKVDIPSFAQASRMGLEEAARLKRYGFLEKIRHKTNAHYICIAHHAEDLAEDVLMRLCRGTAWPALGGMKALCTQRKILRPLLQESKKELIYFVNELNIPFATDKSNEDQLFLRNRVRKTLLPFFLSENPSFLDSIENLHRCAQRDDIFFQEHITEFWKTVKMEGEKITIQLKELQNTQETMRFRIYMHALSILGKGYTQHETLENLDYAVMQNKGNNVLKFTHGARAKIFKNTLIFY